MGGPSANSYQSQPLSQNVQNTYGNALQSAGNYGAGAQTAFGLGNEQAQGASGIFNQMGGYNPQNVTAGQLSTTDLSPYMNPYTQNVIDTSMNELNRQHGIQQQGIDDASLNQNAFGGDRMYLQKGTLGGDFIRNKGNLLADLNSRNFLNAQQMGQYDIGNRLRADESNQTAGLQGQQVRGQAGQGLGSLANMYGNVGTQLGQLGSPQVMGGLANMGFGWGNTLQQNQAASGALQQQQQQALMDAIRAQYGGYTGGPQNALSQYLGAILSPPASAGTTSSNPGVAGYLGMATSLANSFMPF